MRLTPLLLCLACGPATGHLDHPSDPAPPDPEDADDADDPLDPDAPPPEDDLAPDLRARGPHAVTVGQRTVQTSCAMAVTTWLPDEPPVGVVIVAHGFARSRERMTGWADHWASWGLAVAAPDLCHASFFNTDHPQNAADLVALASELSPDRPVAYAGHSAGALAAFLAAAADTSATLHLGLDLTDSDGLALAAAASLEVPSFGLLADPDSCNANGNGLPAYQAAPDGRALRLLGSDHCDYEAPTDWACTTFCASGPADSDAIRTLIRALSTAALLAPADPVALQWWTEGTEWWEALLNTGLVQPL